MVTLQKLVKERNQILDKCLELRKELSNWKTGGVLGKKKELKRLKAMLPTLKSAILYMETNPSEQFLINEKNRVNRMINNRMDSFPEPLQEVSLSVLKKAKKEFEKEHEIPKLRTQLKMINYLLKD